MSLRAWTSGPGRFVAGRYELLHRLGGAGGRVWLALDHERVVEVVLREAAPAAPGGAGPRCADVLRGHPHVAGVHDVLDDGGRRWTVTEYVAGAVHLRELVARRGPPAPAAVARIGLAVLDALTAGHARGLTHGDVSAANVLLAPDATGAPHGRVLLAGYGIAGPDAGSSRGPAPQSASARAGGGPPGPAGDLFALGRTLYFAVEGRDPFDAPPGTAPRPEPRAPVRAGALEPVLRGLLVCDPRRRTTATAAGAELERIVLPHSESQLRPRTDPVSEPPWGDLSRTTPVTGSRTAPAPRPGGARRRPRPYTLRALLAGGLGLALSLGGAWYALADRTGGGGGPAALPYGEAVGLAEPLREGDCVLADWPTARRFAGAPRLTVDPSCADRAPDGQVMAVVEAASAEEARDHGAARCEERTRQARERLADVRWVAVVPPAEGFEAAGRRTACLVLGAHGPVSGPLGDRRRFGTEFADTATMQRRDCLDATPRGTARLVPCGGRYEEQVLGFTRLGEEDVPRAGAGRGAAVEACAREVPPRDYGFDPSLYVSGAWTSDKSWQTGPQVAVCTVKRRNGGTMEGTEP
ncbi:septum formation family protein [Streptomyces sp. NPDC101219]|uniref:septum formation family protein n=1 Tax=Streptomyces sp. NPDC101219 TaxID=3366131 RepID=UPI00381E692C